MLRLTVVRGATIGVASTGSAVVVSLAVGSRARHGGERISWVKKEKKFGNSAWVCDVLQFGIYKEYHQRKNMLTQKIRSRRRSSIFYDVSASCLYQEERVRQLSPQRNPWKSLPEKRRAKTGARQKQTNAGEMSKFHATSGIGMCLITMLL